MKLFGHKNSNANELAEYGCTVQYESMDEYERMLSEDKMISNRDNSSITGDESFTGTESFEEAEKLRRYGDRKSAKSILKVKESTDKVFEKVGGLKVKQFNDVQGFQPIVPNAIMGLPISMVNQKRLPKKIKTMDIFVNMSTVWSTNTETIRLRGAYVLSAIDALERAGYRVNLYIGNTAIGAGNRVVGSFINIKSSDQPMNIMKIAYYLVNPSFLRRTQFRICETEENLPDITGGYGKNRNFEDQRAFIRKAMKTPQMVVIDSAIEISTDNTEDENIEIVRKAFNGYLDLGGEDK